jgi:hypothetical protein
VPASVIIIAPPFRLSTTNRGYIVKFMAQDKMPESTPSGRRKACRRVSTPDFAPQFWKGGALQAAEKPYNDVILSGDGPFRPTHSYEHRDASRY